MDLSAMILPAEDGITKVDPDLNGLISKLYQKESLRKLTSTYLRGWLSPILVDEYLRECTEQYCLAKGRKGVC